LHAFTSSFFMRRHAHTFMYMHPRSFMLALSSLALSCTCSYEAAVTESWGLLSCCWRSLGSPFAGVDVEARGCCIGAVARPHLHHSCAPSLVSGQNEDAISQDGHRGAAV